MDDGRQRRLATRDGPGWRLRARARLGAFEGICSVKHSIRSIRAKVSRIRKQLARFRPVLGDDDEHDQRRRREPGKFSPHLEDACAFWDPGGVKTSACILAEFDQPGIYTELALTELMPTQSASNASDEKVDFAHPKWAQHNCGVF